MMGWCMAPRWTVQTGGPLHADVTAFLLARGASPLRQCNRITVVAEAGTCGHWLAAETCGRGPGGSVPCQISRPAVVASTCAGLIEWQTIKLPSAVQGGL
jgi:hypothetical protein